ncbi:MKI67 FHA domain-interacting nucleolar phosphoprotein-like [Macaca nemestrina]|uniref:MKI67 FHA domain-interacting nucleolar phosphoprotein-like n=1 Tax=Macaca nemestrina TaxID=9545 RepID=UPI0039B9B25A
MKTRQSFDVLCLELVPSGGFVVSLTSRMKPLTFMFGTVTWFRLFRSKRTGNSKGSASVKFEFEDVAKMVAETMNNYLFGERLVECHYMPPEKVHKEIFKDWNVPFKQPSYPSVKWYNQNWTLTQKLRMEE